MAVKHIITNGDKFNRWTVLNYSGIRYKKCHFYLCKCDCGSIAEVYKLALVYGRSKSCGCINREITIARNISKANKNSKSYCPTYKTWERMIFRCASDRPKEFKSYKGKGIKVCDRWLNSYENFLSDMGYRPDKNHSIDRIDNDKSYSPENCRWATNEDQARNRSITVNIKYKDDIKTLVEWSEILKISYFLLYDRIFRLQWDVERAFTDRRIRVWNDEKTSWRYESI